MNLTNVLVIILIIVIINDNMNSVYMYFKTEEIQSDIDGQYYKVVSKYNNKKQASNLISEINLFTLEVINKLEYIYIHHPNKNTTDYEKGRIITTKLLNNYNPRALTENDPTSPDKTSFTRGKGELISLCIREKKTGKNLFHDKQIVKFVQLHEIAHVVTISYSHTHEFWTNFRFILEFCEKYGIYVSDNYKKNNVIYCGLLVKYNPKYDNKIPSYFD